MSRSRAAVTVRSASTRRQFLRSALVVATGAALLAATHTAGAQEPVPARNGWEVLFSTGALVPTGSQRNVLEDAALSAAQVSYVVRSRYAITTMAGWARSRDIASVGDPKLDVFTFDVGAEARAPRTLADSVMTLTPFAGVGVGSRSYNYRSLDVGATHNVAAYAAVGGELGRGRLRLRLELRDYVGGFKPLGGSGTSATRNDVVALVGLRFTRRGA
jgi:hypothetical protein